MMKGPAAMTITIAKNDSTRVKKTMGVEERKSHFAISTKRIKAIG